MSQVYVAYYFQNSYKDNEAEIYDVFSNKYDAICKVREKAYENHGENAYLEGQEVIPYEVPKNLAYSKSINQLPETPSEYCYWIEISKGEHNYVVVQKSVK